MDTNTTISRFAFLAEAFEGAGGFAPQVSYENQTVTSTDQEGNPVSSTRRVAKVATPSHLIQYPRESAEKYAARCALATYENHLREACERFVGYLGRRRPMRDGIDAPLVRLLLDDADMRGTSLDLFMFNLALEAKARGSVLLLIDMPGEPGEDAPASLLEQIERRRVPFLRVIKPEIVASFEVDDETGLLESLAINVTEEVDGKETKCVRTWDREGWRLMVGERTVREGTHPFKQCPVLAFTESGGDFPQAGKYAQIADLSKRAFNARSELDELLRGQTFSLLTLQVPSEASAGFDPAVAAATIGTHSMLIHAGATPAFISPDSGPANTYLSVLENLQQSIKRIAMDEATTEAGGAESGVARRLRFERLNSDLASFAGKLQGLERRMWSLFHRAIGTTNRVTVEWPTDFNLVDTLAELDVLTAMQGAGFPAEVLATKRAAIVNSEFDASDDETKAMMLAAIEQQAQEPKPEPTLPEPPQGGGEA